MPLKNKIWGLLFGIIYSLGVFGSWGEAGQTNQLSIIYNIEEQPSEKTAIMQIIQAQLGEKGIQVKLEPLSNTIFYERLDKADYQAAFTNWYIDYNDPEGFLTDFYSKASYRMAKYNDPEFDRLYLGGLTAPSEKEKFDFFRQAEKHLGKTLPWVPLYSNNEIFLFNRKASGFRSNAFQYYDYKRADVASLRVATDIEPQTLNPALTYDLASKHIVCQSYEGLIAMDDKNRIISNLAYEWYFSKNNDELTFKLRDDVSFHDSPLFSNKKGRNMDASDVKFSFERLLQANSPYGYIFDHVQGVKEFKAGKSKNVSGFKVVAPHTFRILLDKPFPTMLPWLLAPAAYIIPRDTPGDYDFTRGSIGTGPFVLDSFNGSVARFHANKGYWEKDKSGKALPYAKELEIRIMLNANLTWTAFKQEELDIFNVPLSLFNEIFEADGRMKPEWSKYGYRETTLTNLKFLVINMEKDPWGKDVELRKKISSAIDRGAFVKWVYKGKAREAHSIIPEGLMGF